MVRKAERVGRRWACFKWSLPSEAACPCPVHSLTCFLLVCFLNIYLCGCSGSLLWHAGSFSCGMWDLFPWSGIKPMPPALAAWSLSHWTTREVLTHCFWSSPSVCIQEQCHLNKLTAGENSWKHFAQTDQYLISDEQLSVRFSVWPLSDHSPVAMRGRPHAPANGQVWLTLQPCYPGIPTVTGYT